MLTTEHRLLIQTLIHADPFRMKVLSVVRQIERSLFVEAHEGERKPDLYVAAGFVRNLVWDALHENVSPTPLNDIDVIYFDQHSDKAVEQTIEQALSALFPANWQVRNQALMHHRNQDSPYTDVVDAMRYWPEKETGFAARLNDQEEINLLSAFDSHSLFALHVTPTGRQPWSVINRRVTDKNWLAVWPKLQVISN